MQNRGLIFLKNKFLYIANDGLPFDREGILAISQSNISAKNEHEKDRPFDPLKHINDNEWIKKYHDFQVQNYINNPNRIVSDRRNEEGTTRDYSNRWLFELLQNIDDAMGAKDYKKYIGTKGLGFRSILEIGNCTEIFSGNYDFMFSRQKSVNSLKNTTLEKHHYKHPPSFHIIHETDPDYEVNKLKKNKFSTIIKIHLHENKIEDVIDILDTININFLMFSRNIEILKIRIDEKVDVEYSKNSKNLSCLKDSFKDKVSVTKKNLKNKTKAVDDWILWGREWVSKNQKLSSCMFAVPFIDGKCISTKNSNEFYNFFPTIEDSSINALIHITFQLSQDRNRLQMWGDEERWGNEACDNENLNLIEKLKSLVVEDVINDKMIQPDEVLKIFSELNNLPEANSATKKGQVSSKVKYEILKLISNTNFIPIYGEGLSSPKNIQLWKKNFLECFEETNSIQRYNLPYKNINKLDHIINNYGGREININNFIEIINDDEILIKNNTDYERHNFIELIIYYFEGQHFSYYTYNLFHLKLFENTNNKLLCLDDGPFLKKDMKNLPSFLNLNILKNTSYKLLKKLSGGLSIEDDKENLMSNVISDDFEIISHIPDIITNWNQYSNETSFSWSKYGYELLFYLTKEYQTTQEKKDLAKTKVQKFYKLEDCILLPTSSSNWIQSNNVYFSKSWNISENFNNWLKNQIHYSYYELENKSKILKKFEFFSSNSKKFKIKPSIFKSFLILLGVKDFPALKKLNDNKFYRLPDEYKNHPLNREHNYWSEEYEFEDIDYLFANSKMKVSIDLVLRMVKYAKNFPSQYRVRRGNWHTLNKLFENFGIFQLSKIKWFFHKKSIIRPDGLFSPHEIIISENENHPFLPIIKKSWLLKIFKKEDINFLIKNLGINTSYNKSDRSFSNLLVTWFGSTEEISKNYQNYSKDVSPDIAKAELKILYREFFGKVIFQEKALIPCQIIGKEKKDVYFLPADKVYYNNLHLEFEQLEEIKFLNGVGILFIQEIDNHFDLTNITQLIEVNIDFDEIDENLNNEIFNYFESKWELILFFLKEMGHKSKYIFKDVKSKITLCENLELIVLPVDKKNCEKQNIKVNQYFKNVNFLNISSNLEDDLKLLIKFISNNLLKMKGGYSTIKEIIFSDSWLQIEEVFKNNDIDPSAYNDFKLIYLKNEEKLIKEENFQKDQIEDQTNDLNSNIKKNNEKFKSLKEENKNDGSNNKSSLINRERTNISPKQTVKNKNQKFVKLNNKNIRFGTRLSGHIRVGNSKIGIRVRDYFDDETLENQAIGKKGEAFVYDLLVGKYGKKNVILHGGNNKGFDIEFNDESNNLNFVEVKSMLGQWKDNDVLLSSSQFERSQIEKDKYYIYVVENLMSEGNEELTIINNPSRFFTKMQLDHGWKNFNIANLNEPEIGDYVNLKINGKKVQIINIRKLNNGKNFKLFLKDNTSIMFNPNEMTLEKKS